MKCINSSVVNIKSVSQINVNKKDKLTPAQQSGIYLNNLSAAFCSNQKASEHNRNNNKKEQHFIFAIRRQSYYQQLISFLCTLFY